ncbi:MAG: type II secretion system protein, partial [Phycisphaerales bacterium]
MPDRPRRGFTIVEILVVLGIIVLLVGLLAVGLQAAGRSARKAKELNTGRQVGLAWSQYSATYEEKLIPGWLEPEVQQAWKVKYKNSAGDTLAPEYCRTYSWRLLPFLAFDFETLYTYLELEEANFNANPAVVSDNPAFGINAYYVGGWWEPFASDPGLPATGRPARRAVRRFDPAPERSGRLRGIGLSRAGVLQGACDLLSARRRVGRAAQARQRAGVAAFLWRRLPGTHHRHGHA